MANNQEIVEAWKEYLDTVENWEQLIEGVESKPHSGHVTVFDRVINDKVRIVDASPKQPKWREVEPSLLFDAIRRHGNENSGGIWYFSRS